MNNLDLDSPLTNERRDAIIDSIAGKIIERRLESPAVLFLEMHKPLSFLASQSVLVAMPLFGPLLGAQRMADLSKILSNRENLDLLINRIEDMAAQKDESDRHAADGQV